MGMLNENAAFRGENTAEDNETTVYIFFEPVAKGNAGGGWFSRVAAFRLDAG